LTIASTVGMQIQSRPQHPACAPSSTCVELTAMRARSSPNTRLDRLGLGDITLRRRGSMRVDVIDFVEIEITVFEAALHALGGALPLRRWRRDVIGVGVCRHSRLPPQGFLTPREIALSRSSRTREAAPSAITKPSRSRSNGRLAAAGLSLRVDNARIATKPPTPKEVIAAPAPPVIAASRYPARIIR